mmetsp:Transcript_45278/g.113918  ORF Transcript_45278/g.113918 Transcript_45278/m.113918 type:complete len:88 (-) Transcript_45278:31-294(-)
MFRRSLRPTAAPGVRSAGEAARGGRPSGDGEHEGTRGAAGDEARDNDALAPAASATASTAAERASTRSAAWPAGAGWLTEAGGACLR